MHTSQFKAFCCWPIKALSSAPAASASCLPIGPFQQRIYALDFDFWPSSRSLLGLVGQAAANMASDVATCPMCLAPMAACSCAQRRCQDLCSSSCSSDREFAASPVGKSRYGGNTCKRKKKQPAQPVKRQQAAQAIATDGTAEPQAGTDAPAAVAADADAAVDGTAAVNETAAVDGTVAVDAAAGTSAPKPPRRRPATLHRGGRARLDEHEEYSGAYVTMLQLQPQRFREVGCHPLRGVQAFVIADCTADGQGVQVSKASAAALPDIKRFSLQESSFLTVYRVPVRVLQPGQPAGPLPAQQRSMEPFCLYLCSCEGMRSSWEAAEGQDFQCCTAAGNPAVPAYPAAVCPPACRPPPAAAEPASAAAVLLSCRRC